jgi:hypothetical protein
MKTGKQMYGKLTIHLIKDKLELRCSSFHAPYKIIFFVTIFIIFFVVQVHPLVE